MRTVDQLTVTEMYAQYMKKKLKVIEIGNIYTRNWILHFYSVSWGKSKVWFIAQLGKQKEILHTAGGNTLENCS